MVNETCSLMMAFGLVFVLRILLPELSRVGDFSLPVHPECLWAHPPSYQMVTKGFFLGAEVAGA
jgi:hypothetical protein